VIGIFSLFRFEQESSPILQIEVSCHFQIAKDSWEVLLDPESKQATVPKGFISHLVMLTIGTTRGVLHAKTEGCHLIKLPYQSSTLAELIKEDVFFKD
jgi:hypothetical protein